MAFSKYYTGYQAPQQQSNGTDDLLEMMRKLQEQQQAQNQQNQPSSSDYNNAGKFAKMGKQYYNQSASIGGGTGTGAGQGFESFGAGGANGGGLGYDMNGFMGQGTPSADPSWYSNLFSSTPAAGSAGGAGGASAAAGSNPYGWIAAALLSANVAHNKGISNWGDTAKGQLANNTVDYYQGRKDGKQHGAMSKILDPDGATGQLTKAFTDFSTLDFGNGLKGVEDGLKSLFKLKLF